MLTHVQLRQKFSEFWKKRNHKESPPILLVPQNDSTTLFTGSGMQPLVPYLLGEPHPQGNKLYNIQPCFRSQDIDEVGDNRHTTFFEMMGNWSLGDYFKKEQLTWFWEFLTDEIKLSKEKLYVTVFGGDKKNNLPPDEESIKIWEKSGVPENKIFKYGPEKNWWSRAGVPDNMPAGEPGGPDSEVFYEFTQIPHDKKFGDRCHPNCDCGRFLEIGNSVFMQYKKNGDGTFSDLPAMNVDFGGGLERILAASNNDPDVFKIDVLWPIILRTEEVTKKTYKGNEKYMRKIADHVRASVFLIANGIEPYKTDRGSVLRKLIQDSVDAVQDLGIKHSIISYLAEPIINSYKNSYSEIKNYDEKIKNILSIEEQNYLKRIISEESTLKQILIKQGLETGGPIIDGKKIIDGKILFDLKQSKGISLPTINRFLKSNKLLDKLELDLEGYEKALEKHRKISRKGATKKFKGGLADQSEQTIKYHTATHLLHQALFDTLGDSIRQEGSNITGERLRFDFYSVIKPTNEQIKQVEKIINDKINEKLPVSFKIIPKDEALKLGAKSFFREKYPEMVKVYFVGNYSKEFCGGPHVKNTFEIGKIEIYKFEKIGSNLYRIYAKGSSVNR